MLGVFLDIETTGLDPVLHVPIDIAFVVIDLNQGKEVERYHSLIVQSPSTWKNHDPESLKVNGLSLEDVSHGKSLSQIKGELIAALLRAGVSRGKAVFICQNPGFDRGFFNQIIDVYSQEKLNFPYHWLDLASMYWTTLKAPYPGEMRLSKNSIAMVNGLPKEVEPHRALNGVLHLIECYQKVMGVKILMRSH